MSRQDKNFETARTKHFRAKALTPSQERTIASIEQFGCQVIHAQLNGAAPDFFYTVGLFDTCGQPEVLVTGLSSQTAHFLLNQAAARLREGKNLSIGRHKRLLDRVECEFRPVAPKWVDHLMGASKWFYKRTRVSVLQAVFPDRKNRFPEDDEFDPNYRQPLLQSISKKSIVERVFWSAANLQPSYPDWRFPDPPNRLVIVSAGVNSENEPITLVARSNIDNTWQFVGKSGAGKQMPVAACFRHVIDKDPTLIELADLPLGWEARRKAPGKPWRRSEWMEIEY